jgi:ABC-type protease/lipase transport system fused ATPase/permease subunit
LIAHRPSVLAACDNILVLANGAQQAFGPRDQIMRKVIGGRPATPPITAGNLKVVSDTSDGDRK